MSRVAREIPWQIGMSKNYVRFRTSSITHYMHTTTTFICWLTTFTGTYTFLMWFLCKYPSNNSEKSRVIIFSIHEQYIVLAFRSAREFPWQIMIWKTLYVWLICGVIICQGNSLADDTLSECLKHNIWHAASRQGNSLEAHEDENT